MKMARSLFEYEKSTKIGQGAVSARTPCLFNFLPKYGKIKKYDFKEETAMKRKGLVALGLVMSMSLSLPLLSYAQGIYESQEETSKKESCPLLINGQEVAMVEGFSLSGLNGDRYFGAVIMVGTDRLEDSDLVVTQGIITEKQLNTDNGKLPEFDMSEATISSMFGTSGKVDHITIEDSATHQYWDICLYRLPDSMSSEDELKEYKQYAITAKGYQNTTTNIGWQKNDKGYWYNYGNGVYPADEWKEIDGKSYYFGYDGYMWADGWTPDGYFVDASGAWVRGYDEELTAGATISYREIFYDENGVFARDEWHEIPVSKVSETNDLYDNFKENESPAVERLAAIMIYAKSYKEKYPNSR